MISTVHPALTKNHIEISIPSQSRADTFGSCITSFVEWFRREEHGNHLHYHGNKIELIIQNLWVLHSDPLITRLETCYPFYQDWLTENMAPFDFKMHRLTNTLTHWLETMDLDNKIRVMTLTEHSNIFPTSEPNVEHVSMSLCVTIANGSLDADEEHFTSEATSLRAFCQPNLTCDLYSMSGGHDEHSCDFSIRCVLAAEHVKKDP